MIYGDLDIETATKQVLGNSTKCRGTYRGLRQVARAIEQRQAVCCFLAENCNDKAYSSLIEGLCREREVPLIKVPDNKKLGEMAGLCKYDKEGKPRKVVSASCVAVKDIGEESNGWSYLVDKYHIPVQRKE